MGRARGENGGLEVERATEMIERLKIKMNERLRVEEVEKVIRK